MITATATLTQTISVTASLGGSICLPATYTLVNTNTPPDTLDSGSIVSGGGDVIVAPPVDISVNGSAFGTSPSGVPFNVRVVDSALNPRGSKIGANWRIADSIVTINTVPSDVIVSEQTYALTVTRDSLPYTPTYNPATNTLNVNSAPCVGGSVSVAVSNLTPTFGQSVTITATPSGYAPTSYLFFAFDGSAITYIAQQAGNAVNWTVSLVGAFTVYALGTDGSVSSYGTRDVVATSALILDSIGTMPVAAYSWARRLTVNYLGDAMIARRSSDNAVLSIGYVGEPLDSAALIAFVGVGNGFDARIFDQVGSNNPEQLTAGMQPSIVISGSIQLLSGKPTVVFDGSTDEMTIPSAITFRHGFMVAAKSSNTNGLQYLVGGTGQGLTMGGTILPQIAAVTAGGNLISAIDNTARHQISIRLGVAGAGRLQVDGVTQATGTTSATMVIDRIGTRPDAVFRHIGACSELIFYTNALSDADNLILNNNQLAYYP